MSFPERYMHMYVRTWKNHWKFTHQLSNNGNLWENGKRPRLKIGQTLSFMFYFLNNYFAITIRIKF